MQENPFEDERRSSLKTGARAFATCLFMFVIVGTCLAGVIIYSLMP